MYHQTTHYSLGQFRRSRTAALTALLEQADRLPLEELDRRIQVCVRDDRPTPDLLAVLPADHPDRAWLEALLGVVTQVNAEGGQLELLECSHGCVEQGEAAVAFVDHSLAQNVRVGDEVEAGFLVLRASGGSCG